MPMDSIKCNKCANDNHEEFKWVKDASKKSGGRYVCCRCAKARMDRYRAKPESKAKRAAYLSLTKKHRAEKAQEYYKDNREFIIEQTTKYRKSNPKITEKRNKKQRVSGANIKRGKEQRGELKNHYIVSEIMRQTGLCRQDILDNPDLIELKRMQILLYRAKKEAMRRV